jgi:hypothetical protein
LFHQRSRHAIQNETTVQNRRVGPKAVGPQLVPHHEHRGSVGLSIFRRQAAANHRRNAQELERIGRHQPAIELLCALVGAVQNIFEGARDHAVENVIALGVIQEFRSLERGSSERRAA